MNKNLSCDVELQFNLGRNSKIQFYDSTGAKTWNWQNDTLDFIYAYFHSNTSFQNLVQIDSIMILNGGNENDSNVWEFCY
jgi:hypothetical protein